tara:strand:+ start:2334 stop:2765 length:432 start_codon:yes stop_codon:yes gene_type:complete
MPEPTNTNIEERKMLSEMLRVLYPHQSFGTEIYQKAADAVIAASEASPAQKLTLQSGIRELDIAGFDKMDPKSATNYVKSIEGNAFFAAVTGPGLVALYSDHDVWKILGYEGASHHLGGYVNRGFDDLDWLPEPRITEYEEAQ